MRGDFPEEQWMPIAGFPHYEVSSLGQVRNISRSRLVKPFPRGYENQYLGVDLWRYGMRHPALVHRLVAAAFLPRDRRRREVNHIDCDPTNNCAENLEWCTRAENEAHKTFWDFAGFEKSIDQAVARTRV